jgi:hypothetical protein
VAVVIEEIVQDGQELRVARDEEEGRHQGGPCISDRAADPGAEEPACGDSVGSTFAFGRRQRGDRRFKRSRGQRWMILRAWKGIEKAE